MEAEFQERIFGILQLAFEEKIKTKKRLTKQVLEDLEKCKAHEEPITEKDIHKLDKMTYDELIHVVRYLKRTIAPQLRFKRNVEGKMVKYEGKITL